MSCALFFFVSGGIYSYGGAERLVFCRGKVNTVSFESQQFFPECLCAGRAWFGGLERGGTHLEKHRQRRQRPVALACGELLPQPLCGRGKGRDMVFPYSAFETRRENTGKREEDARMSEREAEGFPRPKETDSRCRVLQNVTEAWATDVV